MINDSGNEFGPQGGAAVAELPWYRKPLSEMRRDRSTILAAVALGLFVDMVVYGVVVPILPAKITGDLGLEATDVGVLFACYSIGLLSITPVIGYLSDKFQNRQMPMLCGLLGLGFSTIMFGFANTYWELILARIAQGVSGGISWTIGLCVVADIYLPQVLGEKMSKAFSANTIGLLVGPPLGGLLYGTVGYVAPFLFCAALAFVDFAVWAWIRMLTPAEIAQIHSVEMQLVYGSPSDTELAKLETPVSSRQKDDAWLNPEDDSPEDNLRRVKRTSSRVSVNAPINRLSVTPSVLSEAVTINLEESPEADQLTSPSKLKATGSLSTWALLSRVQVLLTLTSIFITASAVAGLEPIVPLFLETKFGLSSVAVGLIYGGSVLPSIVGALVIGPISDKYGRKNITGYALVCAGVACASAFLLSSSIVGSVLVLVLVSVTTSATISPSLPELGEMVRELGGGANAQIYALFNIAYGVGMTVGPLLTTAVYQRYSIDNTEPAKGFVAALLVVGLMLTLWSPVMLFAHHKQKLNNSLI